MYPVDDDTEWMKEGANIEEQDADMRGPARTGGRRGRSDGRKQESDEDDLKRESDGDENVQIKIMPGGNRRVRIGGTDVQVQSGPDKLSTREDYDDTRSTWTTSTGKQSQRGATWDRAMTQTMNSGFGSGTPRTMGRKGVREGRENEVLGRRKTHGVGRTGKGPAPVPKGMLRALGVPDSEDENYDGDSAADSVSEQRGEYRSDVEDVFERRRQARAVKFADDDYGNEHVRLLDLNPKSPWPAEEPAPPRSISERREELEPNNCVPSQGSGYEHINWRLRGAQTLKENIDRGLVLTQGRPVEWPSQPPFIPRRVSMNESSSDRGDSDAKRRRRVAALRHRATVLSRKDLDKAEAKRKADIARAEQERLRRTRRDEAAWADCSSSDSDEYQDAQERPKWKRQDHEEPSWLASLVPEKWRPKWSWIAE